MKISCIRELSLSRNFKIRNFGSLTSRVGLGETLNSALKTATSKLDRPSNPYISTVTQIDDKGLTINVLIIEMRIPLVYTISSQNRLSDYRV